MSLRNFVMLAIILLGFNNIGVDASLAHGGADVQESTGLGSFPYDTVKGRINVWYFRPPGLTANSPIVFVMHGVHRDARRYCQDWIPYATKLNFLLVCPEFDERDFPSRAYQRGNMFDKSNNAIAESDWTFTVIESLFDYVRKSMSNSSTRYYIYGHSAGAQFVHRFVLFMPNARYERAIAANPGWYTMPSYSEHSFPYGLRHANLDEQSLKASMSRDFVLLLGDQDIDAEDPDLKKTRDAEEQGATRLERGQNFFRTAQSEAVRLGAILNWQLRTVPGARHSDAQMAQAAASILFAK